VNIAAANAACSNAHKNFIRTGLRNWKIGELKLLIFGEQQSLHTERETDRTP
jgi:hypothetical protein